MSRLIAEFAGPPADRMAGRAQARAARANLGSNISATLREGERGGREALLDQAVHAGVISSGLRAHYAACYDADPEGTRAYLSSLGLRPSAPAASEEYPTAGLSRSELNRIEAAREGRTSRIVNGGL
jgi:hypothetical protein